MQGNEPSTSSASESSTQPLPAALSNDGVEPLRDSQTTTATIVPAAPISAKRKGSPAEGSDRNRARLTAEPGGSGASSDGDSDDDTASFQPCVSDGHKPDAAGTSNKQQLSWADQGKDAK